MSTSVSVMRPQDTMRRYFQEHFFWYVGSSVSFTLLRISHVRKNKWIVYLLAASPSRYLLKLKMLQYLWL